MNITNNPPVNRAFVELRKQMVAGLGGHHVNSVSSQLHQMCKDATFFGTINELWRRHDGNHQPNYQLFELFRLGYVVRQVLGIRRLVDKRDDVISLKSIALTMKKNIHLLSRANIICHDGCIFDVERAKEDYFSSIDIPEGANGIVNPGDRLLAQKFFDSDLRHKAFDRISEQGVAGRGDPRDRISERVLEIVLDEMDSGPIKRVQGYVNKFLAHSDSKADPADPTLQPTFNDILDSIKILSQIHAFLLGNVLWESSMTLVPVPQFDNIKHLDQPLIPPTEIQFARDIWKAKAAEIDGWTQGDEHARFYVNP
jgi:hypothetical protein